VRKTKRFVGASLLAAVVSVSADSTINATNRHAYGANAGWVNARGNVVHGAVIGRAFCSGYFYGANFGWVCLGDGSPGNGYAYSNVSSTDYGVNHDGQGNLRGYAYGANVGWINFEANGAAKVDLSTGVLSGYAYGANIGWISLSNAHVYVQTDVLDAGPDGDDDGIPDPWEYARTGNTNALTADGDRDGDGVPDVDEYTADTDPSDKSAFLRITSLTPAADDTISVVWTAAQTRQYRLECAAALDNPTVWSDSGLGLMPPDKGETMACKVPTSGADEQLYRVGAVVPLVP